MFSVENSRRRKMTPFSVTQLLLFFCLHFGIMDEVIALWFFVPAIIMYYLNLNVIMIGIQSYLNGKAMIIPGCVFLL